ncbi:MAG: MFS transporter [Cyanobacteria bacterium SZAS LIN-2]|nr:MFS transporter [Cyanobacteria bacterium SZAS LIN-2]
MKNAFMQFLREASTSLQYRNIKLYCAGAVISLFGSMMQESMIAWVAYKLTGSTAVLGTVMSCYMLPMILASIPGGWLADRFSGNRKKIVMATQAIALAIALSYVAMAALGTLSMSVIYLLSALLGVTVAFEMASRMAMLPSLVDDPRHIGNAFALDSLIFYACRLCGPAVGALFLVTGNPAWGFAVNALSYVLELCFLSQLKPARTQGSSPGREPKAGLKEAFVFAYGNARRRQVMVLLAVTTFFGVYIQLMPAFTAMRHGSALTNGFLIFASEIGAVIASLLIANKMADGSKVKQMRRWIGWAGVIFAVCLALFATAQSVWLSLILMLPVGFAMSAIFAGAQAVLQVEVEDRVRGAFTAMFYNFAYFGMLALGGPVLGYLATVFGLTATTCGAAACCLLASCHYLRQDARTTP